MTVSFGPDHCHGSGACAHRVPSVVACEDGYGLVRSAAREHSGGDALVQEAVERCPSPATAVTG
ncbi:ferredoxin [Streptomyces sp. NPDC004629]|uniref:ferredoxin n=1 Tax=Streptomyces sp. NPDC004629 TaxID=3364705 RepID=UPI0036B067C2